MMTRRCPTCGQPMPKGKLPRPQLEERAEEPAPKEVEPRVRKPKGK